jgi:Spy/CpxP family protein refolding chaperone
MKLSRISLAILAATSLLSLAPSVRAEDPAAPTPPPTAARRAGGGRMTAEARLKELTEKLTLTAEQQPKVKVVLEEAIKARQDARDLAPEERQPKMKALMEDTNKKMKEILTPEQFTKYEEVQKTQRGPRGPGAGAPGEGGAKKKKKAE